MKYNEKFISSYFIGFFSFFFFFFAFYLFPFFFLPLCRTESPSSAVSELALSVLRCAEVAVELANHLPGLW